VQKVEIIKAYKTKEGYSDLNTLPVKRDWMDATWQKHAYHCFPVTLTNTMGWYLSFPEDITFIWDGVSNFDPSHVKILSGEKYAYPGRANGTISFNTGIKFKTEKDVTLLTMPAPNFFIDGASCFTTLISTSFFRADLPVAWMITSPNKEITIPAGHPICSIIPVKLNDLNNSEIRIEKEPEDQVVSQKELYEYSMAINEINKKFSWSDFYRNGTDHKGNDIGQHDVKSLKLKVIQESPDDI
jgi:hypothetical protein